jgi:hypothetical protein
MKPTSLLLFVFVWATCSAADPAPEPSPAAHVWRQSQKDDPARTFTFTRFALTGKFIASTQGAAAGRPELVVDCIPGTELQRSKGKFLSANVQVGTPLKIVYVEPEEIHGTSYFPKVSIRFRTDGTSEVEDQWSAGADKTSVSVPKEALKKILRGHAVGLSLDDARGSRIAMQFDMADPAHVEESCNVDER